MCLEKLTVGEVIGILHVSCGMVLGDVESLEAFVVAYDLCVILNVEAHRLEDGLALTLNECDGVEGAAIEYRGHRNVKLGHRSNLALKLCTAKLFTLFGDSLRKLVLEYVYLLTEGLLLFGTHILHGFEKLCHASLLAKEINTDLLERLHGLCSSKFCRKFLLQFCNIL